MVETATDSAPGSAALAEGVMIGGKYRLVAELGVGAMGTVWSATHHTLGHQVAIKFLLRSIMASEDARLRFDREAKLAARLGEASRHITRVIDHGVTDDRVPYLVMELLRGEALSARLKRDRRLPLQLTARIVQQLSRALHVAHSAGVVHRDLKPANIFLCTPEQGDEVDVKLLDFGIAKATSESGDDETTGRGQVLGTPSYMSPEQILNDKPVDVRADLWAVAAVVYRMVVGRSPFGNGAIQEIGMRVMSVEPAPPSQIWADIPRELDAWMQRGLAKKPEERFQNARELSDFLAAVAGTSSIPTMSISTEAVQAKILEGAPDESSQSLRTTNGSQIQSRPPPAMPAPKTRWLLPALLGSGAVLALVLFFALRTQGTSGQPGATTEGAAAAPPKPSTESAPAPAPAPVPSPIATPSASVVAAPSTTPKPATTTKVPVYKGKTKGPDGSGWGNKKEL